MDDLKATGRCPICRCEIPALAVSSAGDAATGEAGASVPLPPDAARQCLRCLTWYHQDCWDYGGGCGIFGCESTPPARPCAPPPRPAGPLWERVTRGGIALALGTLVFLAGSVMGLIGYGAAGPLALPVILVLGWLSEHRDQSSSSWMLRRGVLFGPLLLLLLPFPLLYLAVIALGVAVAGLGQVVRCAGLHPRAAAVWTMILAGALSWSHAPESAPVPFSVDHSVPAWALSSLDLGREPRLIKGSELSRAWRAGLHLHGDKSRLAPKICAMCGVMASATTEALGTTPMQKELTDQLLALPNELTGCPLARRLPDGCRVLVLPRGGTDLEVSRGHNRLRVFHGLSPWTQLANALTTGPRSYGRRPTRDPVALVLPAGTGPVVLIERDAQSALLGPRLDEMLRAPGVLAARWGSRPCWANRPFTPDPR